LNNLIHNFKTLNDEAKNEKTNEYIKKLQIHKEMRSQVHKVDFDSNGPVNHRKQKMSEDITSSDLIHRTKVLLLKPGKDNEKIASRNSDKDHTRYNNHNVSNDLAGKYKYKNDVDILNFESKMDNYPRNISSNIRNLGKYEKGSTKFTNFDYKHFDKNCIKHFNNNSKEKTKEKEYPYKEGYEQYKSYRVEKAFDHDMIKKKIDREIYSRQRFQNMRIGSGNNSKENDYDEIYRGLKPSELNKRKLNFDYLHDLNSKLIHF